MILMCFLLAIKLPKLSQNFLANKQRCFISAFDLNLEKMGLNLVSLMYFYDFSLSCLSQWNDSKYFYVLYYINYYIEMVKMGKENYYGDKYSKVI